MTYIGISQRERSRPLEPKGSRSQKKRSLEEKEALRRLEVDCQDFTFAVFFFLSNKSDKEKKQEEVEEGETAASKKSLRASQRPHTKTKWQR